MKKLICWFKGHNWGKNKKEKGWTTDHNRKNRIYITTTHFKSKCKRCGEESYWSNTRVALSK